MVVGAFHRPARAVKDRVIDAAWTVASLPVYVCAVVFIKAADRWLTRSSKGARNA